MRTCVRARLKTLASSPQDTCIICEFVLRLFPSEKYG